jgi:hypothetical protein
MVSCLFWEQKIVGSNPATLNKGKVGRWQSGLMRQF